MFYIQHVVFICFYFIFTGFAEDPYMAHPRIVSDNGNLVIYAAGDKNVSLKTTSRGYINLNNENLVLLMKDARSASETVKRLTSNIINPFTSTVSRIADLVEGNDGLLKRISILENNSTVAPMRIFPRNRNLGALARRVRSLELNMMKIMNLLTNNECSSNPCKNGGECQDLYNGFICRCSETWTGPSCEMDVNECSKFSGTDLGCQNGATCVNKPGSYECICPPGWFGIHCNRRTQDCNSGPPQELCGHGICVSQNTGVGYKCICDQGWTTDGKHPSCTVDVNECESTTPHCSINPPVPCINVPGTFYCGSCPQGYSGNGYYCNDINECLNYNGGCSMSPRVQCINTMGSRMCGACPSGYIGDGISCSFRGLCQINNGGCHALAVCMDNPSIGDNYVQCICPKGYTGNGMGSNGCIRAEIVPYSSACSSNPCIHGTCISHSNDSFTCTCQRGYSGKTCNVQANACDSNPCLNGGTCTNIPPGYVCECTTSYTGLNCLIERQACGGRLMNPAGFLQYPTNNSTNYDHKVSCSWVIETDPSKVLNITFTKFHLESSTNCLYDWVQIHDGPNSAAHIIGRFCGNELPKGGEIISTHNSIYIWFRSDHTVANPGFSLKWESRNPVCGGVIIVHSHGTIKSPGSPGNYPPNRDCEWSLFAQYGKRIQLHFFTLKIGNNPNCSFDYVAIHSGISVMQSLIVKYCNTSHPEPVITAGSMALIHFHSDDTGSDTGFQIAYSVIEGIPGCGGTFSADFGEISSPSHDEQYQSNMDCEYKIKLSKNTRIKITFMSFSLEASIACKFDFVEIREGGRQDSPLVGRYCGSNIPPSYTSLDNELYIRFKTDTFINDDGFRLKYDSVCGGVYEDPSGTIKSPDMLFIASRERQCIYEIKQKPGTAIKLTLSLLSSHSGVCEYGRIEVRDGHNENSTLVGKFCGGETPDEIISTHNYLWIKYIEKTTIAYVAFKANYSTIDLKCGGILKESLGIIKSPESPKSYPPNTQCLWVLAAPPGFVIQLTWISFNMEWTSGCVGDYVSVYENNTESGSSEMLGKYCGKKMPPTSMSSTNLLTIAFISDTSISSDGFIVSYNFLDESKTCGGNYFVTTGQIKSPNYPQNYPRSKDCVWVITVPHGQQIMLNVEDFDLEKYMNCKSDSLEIRNGAYDSSPLVGIFCGTTIPKSIPSHTNNFYIRFRSDSTHSRRGFKIFWDGTTTGCGGTLTSSTGQIISPNYPQPYGQNALCVWKISTSAGSVLRIIFLDLSLEEQLMCNLDYIEIFDGPDYSSKSLGRYCSSTHPSAIMSSTNRAMVKFRSDISHELRGFLIKYITFCNNTVKGYRGVIESLNFPYNYPKNQNCIWTINVPEGNKINISFSHFDLEDNKNLINNCNFDYIEIKELDAVENEEVLLDKVCGNELPPHISSTKNIVKVHFVSDSMIHAPGFRLEWVIHGCSALLTHPTGEISTPGYPYGYPENTICEWKIQVDFDSSVELTIHNFDLEKTADCSYDSVEVFNGPDESAPLLSKFCHANEKGLIITTSSNIMFVKFISDSSYSGRGFKGSYKTVPNQCGGKFTSTRGSIHTRNYPKNYKIKDDCEWLIEINSNYVVELEFDDFDLVSSVNCSNDYLKIYDGNSSDAPLLHTYCGNVKPNGTIRATANTMYLRMSAQSRVTAKGFLANYTSACGTRLVTSSNGILDIADWGTWHCSWTILADTPDKHVSLTITHMDISTNCDTPTLLIYDGDNSESPLLGSYCGHKVPPTIVSKGSAIHINLSYAYGVYLQATYSVISTECGGSLTSLSGYFGSMGYPNSYPMNSECQWTINLAPGNKLALSFLSFDLVSSDNCNADYVEIREKNAGGKLLGTFCGNEIPNNITQTNSLWIQFKSSDIGTAKGFLAEYTLVHGNELFGSKGEIASPLYPVPFTLKEFWFDPITSWRITVDFHSVILITFKDFYIDVFVADDCFIGSLEIFDGYDDTSPVLATLCSLQLPDPIKSSSNVVYIKYTLRSYSAKFFLEWVQIRKPVNIKDIANNLSVDGCGSKSVIELSVFDNYTLTSPGFPNGYAGDLKCEWSFATAPEMHLSIEFLFMNLEASSASCMLDSVKVYSGEDGKANWKLVDTVCLGNASYMANIETTNLMKVVFQTDAHINKTGFSAMITPECGGSVTGPNGIIEISDNTVERSRSYGSYVICEWKITVKAGRTIEVKFLELNISNTEENVCNNYILFKNGKYPESPLLGKGKYCGKTIPQLNTTTGNSLYIKYYGSRNIQGFKLSYKEVSLACGGHIKLSDTYKTINISSPNYPDIPPPHTECIWIISVPSGEAVQIDFIDRFDLTYSSNCTKAGVELRDGGTMVSNLIGVFCQEIPSTQKSTDNIMYVRFFTDVTDPKNGFKATASIATCGGVIRGKSGKLTSPFYPALHSFQPNTECSWQIIGPVDHYLTINFSDFRFPYRLNCSTSNYLEITEKLIFGNETVLGRYCGFKIPQDVRTSSNVVIIKMVINFPARPTKGFSLSFNASQESCGGTIEADSGIITSPGYPVASFYNRNCEWNIVVPKGRRVSVNILDFDLDFTQYFYVQGLAFFNGKKYASNFKYMHSSDKSKVIQSSGNHMLIYFWSSGVSNHRGFKLEFNSDEPTICTGDFNKESGVITAPISNETIYFCQWDRIPETSDIILTNRSLTLNIDVRVIAKSPINDCKHATSSIIVTTDDENQIISQLCDRYTEPQVVRTPYPITKLMITQGKYHGKMNFTILYKVHPCGGIFTSSFGAIASPNFPNSYSGAIDCAWLIKLDEGQSIKLNFTAMDLDVSCTKNFIDIHNGPLPSSPKIGRYCGKNMPTFIQSESNSLWIDYHASVGSTGKGFSLNYEQVVLGCGGIFHDRQRVIETPNYPKAYPNDAECIWEIRSTDGYHIGLQFVDRFHIEESINCTNDYIEVWDNIDDQWISLGRKCGRVQPQTFNSTSSKMKIMFRSNSKFTASGFKATWSFNCGGSFTATEVVKYIISPGYPTGYSPKLNCKYQIVAPKKYINIVFEDFKVEEAIGNTDCMYDNVTITRSRFARPAWSNFRFKTQTDHFQIVLGVFCGSKIPPPIRRPDDITILFRTDEWVNRKGFRLKYFIDSCGGPITQEGEILSPTDLRKEMYYSSVNCIWNITAPPDKIVIVKFTFFELEFNHRCTYDYVELYNGNKKTISERLALLCGNITNHLPVIRSQSNNMLVVMKTDMSNHFKGFKANVMFMYNEKVGCGGTVNLTNDLSTKSIRSPLIGQSSYYEPNLDCHWLIIAPVDQIIELTFDSFHLDVCANVTEKQKCTCDYLEVRDGGSSLSEVMSQVCGHDLPSKVISSSHQLWVRMVTDAMSSSTGFRATAKRVPSICGPSVLQVTDTKQLLTSPNFPENYPNGIRCVWTLRANTTRNRFELHFEHLELQNPDAEDTCNTDKLEIYDKMTSHTISEGLGENFVFTGPKSTNMHLGIRLPITSYMYCGNGQPPDFYSSRNEIIVSFTSDGSINKKGFMLDYRIVGCNRNYTAVQGRILNDGIPKNCTIRITAPANNTISLYFQTFLLTDYQNCKTAGLEVYDGNPNNGTLLAKLCGFQIPNPVFSQTNDVWLKIKNAANRMSIYDIIYTTTNQGRGCGGQIFNFLGKFTSPMYPSNYRNNSVCRWDISVPRGLNVLLKFSVFDLGPINTCGTDFVELIDRNIITKEETVITTYCAGDNPSLFVSSSNFMSLRYTTSVNNGGTGWSAFFTAKEPNSSDKIIPRYQDII